MRHLLTIILSVVILSSFFIYYVNRPDSQPIRTVDNEEEVIDTPSSSSSYQEEPIAEYENIKVYYEYGLKREDWKHGDDMYYKEDSYLVRFENDVPKDSMILVGPRSGIYGEGKFCRVVVGVDTINIDITQPFTETFDLRFKDAITDCHRYRLSRHYALNDKSWPTDFQINVAFRDDTPLSLRNFVSSMIRDDVAGYFTDFTSDTPVSPQIPVADMGEKSVEQMMRYYYNRFCKLYDKEFSVETSSDEIVMGDRYSYQFYAYPVWQSQDSTLCTWRFYNFTYMGGAHGGETDFFLTFDNQSGRILGISDFFTKAEFKAAVEELTRQLNVRMEHDHYSGCALIAELDYDSNVTAVHSKILNEQVNGNLYPRPAITKNGIVFSYQTYEKGSNADGVLHFTQPFKKVFYLKK